MGARRSAGVWAGLLLVLVASHARADTKADARRYFQRGMSLIEAGRHQDGITQLKRAYAIRPHRDVLFNIARAYASIGRLTPAIEAFEGYLAADPPDAKQVRSTILELKIRRRLRRWVNDGMRAVREGRYVEGIDLLKRAYAQRPHPNIMFNIALAYEQAGDVRQAILSYRRYLRSKPKDTRSVERRIARLRRQPRRRPVTPVDPAVPSTLDEDKLARLADMIADRLKAQPPAVAAPPQGPPGAPIEAPPPTNRRAAALLAPAPKEPPSPAPLEAKSGMVYEDRVFAAARKDQAVLDAPNAVTIITEEDIRLSGARSIADLLRRVPGMDVMAMSYSDYNLALRGFNRRIANKILVLIDGRTAYEDFVGGTQWRALSIDLLDIERIEVVRGPGSAIYGAYAYTGTINIITKKPEAIDGSTAQVHAGNGRRFESVYQYGGVTGPVGIRFSVGYDRGDKYELEFDPNRVDLTTRVDDPHVSLDVLRMDGRTEYRLSKDALLYLGGGFQSGSNELYAVANLRNQQTDGEKYSVRLGYESDVFTVRTFYAGTRLGNTPQFFATGRPDFGSQVRFDLISVQPIFRPELQFLGRHAIVVGGEYRFKDIAWDYLNAPQREDHFALFFQDIWTLSPKWSVIASARLDVHPIIGPLGSPRLAAVYKPTPEQAFRLSVGTAFRQPTMSETYLALAGDSSVPAAAVQLVGGFDALKPETIASLDAGYRYRSDILDVEAVGYVNRITDLIVRTPLVPTGAQARLDPVLESFIVAQSFYVNDDRAFVAFGTELSARLFPLDGVDVGANYTLQYIMDEASGERFTDSPVHKVNVWGYLRTQMGLDLGLSGHFVSDQQWVEPEYDPNDPSGFNTDPRPVQAAVVLIGRVGYRLLDEHLELAVSGVNLLDVGALRHREHPFGNRLEARIVGSVTARF